MFLSTRDLFCSNIATTVDSILFKHCNHCGQHFVQTLQPLWTAFGFLVIMITSQVSCTTRNHNYLCKNEKEKTELRWLTHDNVAVTPCAVTMLSTWDCTARVGNMSGCWWDQTLVYLDKRSNLDDVVTL